ncbi:MAG: ABC transporter ATP-binding protein [Clostridiales Family XIII bacterium]|jgi:iron complex transport system ATP-binding protein|nr:ABC transporter ATP-binding protein [Clostridiales Family XIII bacterium]
MMKVTDMRTGYNRKEVVKGISFTVGQGSFTCIIGANGCGKTTALKGMLGLLPLFGGSVSVDGVDFVSAGSGAISAKERAKVLAYIPQTHSIPFPFLVSDVVLLGRTPHLKSSVSGVSEADMEAAYGALEQMRITSIAGEEYTALSGGQQQLVLIARALAQEPRILVMDEPTASLDFGNQQMVLERMRDLTDRGMAVVMVTHDPRHALACADEVIVMDDGVIVMRGSPDEIVTTEALGSIYGAQVCVSAVRLESGEDVRVVIPLSGRSASRGNSGRAVRQPKEN